MEFLKRAIEQIRQMWGNLTSSQRVIVSAIFVAIILLTVWGATVSSTENWARVVGHEVGDDVRGRIIKEFDDANQIYKLENMEILVPRRDRDKVALQLASDGILTGDAIWKFLDQPNIIESRWDKEKKFQRAIQLSLEAMVRSLEPVRNARVLLNPGSVQAMNGFVGDQASASVQVELHSGKTLSSKNVKAIAGAVSRSVSGLTMDQVHIMDTKGTPYLAREAGDIAAAFHIREMEAQYEKRVKDELEAFFPGSMAIVRVIMESKKQKIEDRKVGERVPIKEEERKSTDKGTQGGAVVGIKGEASVDPTQNGGTFVKNDKTESESKTDSAFSTTTTRTDDPGGQIQSVSAAVKWAVGADENGKPDPAYVSENLATVQQIVKRALGPAAKDEDVTVFPFPMSAPEPLPDQPMMEKILAAATAHWAKVVLLLMALFALILVYKIIKSAMPTEMVEEIQSIRTRMEKEEQAVEQEQGAGTDEGAKMKAGIRDMVSKNPSGGGLVLNRWMGGK